MKMKNSRIINLLKADLRATLNNKWFILVSILLSLSFISLSRMEYRTYLQVVYLLFPLGMIPIASSSISSDRGNGFIICVFSTPVKEHEYILSKWLLWVSLGIIYIILTLPVSLFHLFFIGESFLMPLFQYILASILVFCLLAAFSLFISLFCVNDARLSIIIGFIFAMLFYLFFTFLPSGAFGGDAGAVLIYHLSPPVMAGDLLNIWHFDQMYYRYKILPALPFLSLIASILLLLLLVFLSYKIFKDLQNKETFDSRRKTIVAFAIAFLILLPLPISNIRYEIGEKKDLSMMGGGSNMGDIRIPSGLMYAGEPIESKALFEFNVPEIHNLSISFDSKELKIMPESVDIPYIELERGDKTWRFELPITVEPIEVKGAVGAVYSYNAYVKSDEAEGSVERAPLSIENCGASMASIIFLALSFLLAIAIFYFEFRKRLFR